MVLKTKDIIKGMQNFSIIYDGYNISNERITQMYIDYLANTYKFKHNVSYVFDIESLLFKAVTISLSYLINILSNEYNSEDVINDLQVYDKVIYKKQRCIYAGITVEDRGAGRHKYIHLIQDGMDRYILFKEKKNLVPYYGNATALDGRGVRGNIKQKASHIESLFGCDIDFNPDVLDNCTVLVIDRYEAEEILHKLELKTNDDRKIKFLDLATVSYYTENGEHHFSGNYGKNEPVIKITNTLFNARKLIIDKSENEVVNLVVFGNDRVAGNMSVLEEVLNRESLYHIMINEHLNSTTCDDLLRFYDTPEVLAFTKTFVKENDIDISESNYMMSSFKRKYDVIKDVNVKYENVGTIIPTSEYSFIRKALLEMRKYKSADDKFSNFIIQSYSLLKLFRTALFSLDEYECLIESSTIGQKKPSERISDLYDILTDFDRKFQEEALFIVDNLKKIYNQLLTQSKLRDWLFNYISSVNKYRNIAIVIPYVFYSNILYELGIDKNVNANITFYTTNRFDISRCFDDIIVVGDIAGKRFNAFRTYNATNITILGYDNEKPHVNYYARKAKEFETLLNSKIRKSKYIPGDITEPDVVDESILTDFIKTKLNSININNYININASNSNAVTEVVAAATFVDGEKIFFSKGYNAYVFDSGKKNVIKKKIDKIQPGDVLVFTKNGTLTHDIVDEMLLDLVDNKILNEAERTAYEVWQRWKELLKEYVKGNNGDYHLVSKKFKDSGINKHQLTIRTWIDPQYHVSGPKEQDVFTQLGEALIDGDMKENGIKYWLATRTVRLIKTNILKIIGESVINEICGKTSNDPMYKRIRENTRRIADLLEIESIRPIDPTDLSNSIVNRPII